MSGNASSTRWFSRRGFLGAGTPAASPATAPEAHGTGAAGDRCNRCGRGGPGQWANGYRHADPQPWRGIDLKSDVKASLTYGNTIPDH